MSRWVSVETLTAAHRHQLRAAGWAPSRMVYWKPFCTIHGVGPMQRYYKELPVKEKSMSEMLSEMPPAIFLKDRPVPRKMTQEELLKFHETFTGQCRDLSRRKNTDYADANDALSNFTMFGDGDIALQGIVFRLGDKLRRLHAYARRGQLQCEGIEDSLRDVVNYAVLAAALIESTKP